MTEKILLVAPSWVGDAILSEPLVALLREPLETSAIDVLAPPWCAPVYRRMRGIARVIESPFRHGELALGARRRLGLALRESRYARAIVLPNTWKSALAPWYAGIRQRTGYVGEGRYLLLNDARRLDAKGIARLVDRYAALAAPPRSLIPTPPSPVLIPDVGNGGAAMRKLELHNDRPIAVLCPGAEFGPAKRWPAEHFAAIARRFLAASYQVWLVGSANDRAITAQVVATLGALPYAKGLRDLAGQTDLGTAIDLLAVAEVVVTNDSGLMHAAAAVGTPVVAIYGSSSPRFTPPLGPVTRIARIDIACSPCFARECPLGHLRCLRELAPEAVYDLAQSAVADRGAARQDSPPPT